MAPKCRNALRCQDPGSLLWGRSGPRRPSVESRNPSSPVAGQCPRLCAPRPPRRTARKPSAPSLVSISCFQGEVFSLRNICHFSVSIKNAPECVWCTRRGVAPGTGLHGALRAQAEVSKPRPQGVGRFWGAGEKGSPTCTGTPCWARWSEAVLPTDRRYRPPPLPPAGWHLLATAHFPRARARRGSPRGCWEP